MAESRGVVFYSYVLVGGGGMTENQKDMLTALHNCGVSDSALLLIGSIIETDRAIHLYVSRILEEHDQGQAITEGLALRILKELVDEAMEQEF